MHYISLFGYALRSLAQNEFLAPKYSADVGGQTQGEAILGTFEIRTDPAWLWGGVGFLAGFFVLSNIVSGIALEFVRMERNIGTARTGGGAEEPQQQHAATAATQSGAVVIEMPSHKLAPSSSASPLPKSPSQPHITAQPSSSALALAAAAASAQSALPFTPMSIAWRNLRYTVTIAAAAAKAEGRASRDKVLLQSVTGRAAPGKLTALMGASGAGASRDEGGGGRRDDVAAGLGCGFACSSADPHPLCLRRPCDPSVPPPPAAAGKTTLLDVIAGRKNAGRMEGQIFLNGFPREHKSFARLTAYCEQLDVHSPYATVQVRRTMGGETGACMQQYISSLHGSFNLPPPIAGGARVLRGAPPRRVRHDRAAPVVRRRCAAVRPCLPSPPMP